MSELHPGQAALLPVAQTDHVCCGDDTPPALDRPVVLVVDDEELVGTMLHLLLERIGCSVLLARNGLQALEQFRSGRRIALVLLDVRMPGMDGVQTLQALQAADAGVTCCFMTGDMGRYSEEE